MQGLNIYLASRTEEENQIIQRKLECLQLEFDRVRFIGLHPQGLAMSAHEKMSVVVINVREWNRAEMRYVRDSRAAGYTGPILVMAKPNGTTALRNLRAMNNVVFLEKPFEAKDLVGIVRKLLTARVVAQRIHRRFNTSENAEIEFYGKNDRFTTRLCNLSKGGAYLEYPSHLLIRTGDMVRVNVDLKQIARAYSVPARVVWTNRRNLDGGTGVGVEFVGQPEVKKTIVEEY